MYTAEGGEDLPCRINLSGDLAIVGCVGGSKVFLCDRYISIDEYEGVARRGEVVWGM